MGDETVLERILNGEEDPKDLPLALLQSITNDFSDDRKIGQGGFGVVYKGVLRNGALVAVKRIHINEDTVDDKLFRREFNSLWKANNHQNVVRFLGFCSNSYHTTIVKPGSEEIKLANVRERLLCFEYISNGSLDKHITDELRGLEWETRYDIITGICKGLCHLKEKNIIHMDLKPANILLDDHMVPKLTDFGLSRPNENSHTMGQRFGTRGYLAPEYENAGKTSVKSDIYSLGAIIIELITGCMGVPDKINVLRRWRHRWSKPPTLLQYQQVTRCIDIAACCRQQEPGHRPSILEIISILSEPESTNGHTGQVSPCFDEDDMLGIKPLELHLPSELQEEISCFTVQLTNDTHNYIAFNIQLPSGQQYSAQPYKGNVQPESKCGVKIIVQARDVHEHAHADKFIVQSMKVSEGHRYEDITEHMFEEASEVVDEVNLMVVYEPTNPQENCKSREDTNMPAEEVPEMGFCLPNESGLLDASKKGGRMLLDVHPLQLRFPFEPNKLIPCQLNLTNNTDEHVGFRCVPQNPKSFLNGLLRIQGSVPPNSTCIYIVTMEKQQQPPANMDTLSVILESWEGYRHSPVHKVTLTAVCEPAGKMMASEPSQPGIKVMYCRDGSLLEILSMDVHPTKPWILAAHGSGHVSIWNYETQERVMALRPLKEPAPCAGNPWMLSAKFIAREQWFVAGDGYGYIHVLSSKIMDEITEFKAHRGWVESLAIHPSLPLMLSASDDKSIKLWNWESDWSCIQMFQDHSHNVQQVMFNPLEGNTFASASVDGTAKIWTCSSPIPIATLDCHGDGQICVDYFSPGGDRQYVVTGSKNGVARIWDLQTKRCIKKLEGLQHLSGINVGVIDGIQGHPILITSSNEYVISLRNYNTYAYESVVDFNLDRVRGGFTYIKAIKSLVIGFDDGFAIMEIN